jgi:choline-sulfatase
VIKFPDAAIGSRRVSGQVSLVDVAPTVLDALGVPAPPTFEGKSLLDAARGKGAPESEAWAETEHTVDGSRKIALRRGASGKKSIFTLTEGDLQIELFDLGRDPGEMERLDDGGFREALERRLAEYLEETAARRGGKARPEVDLDPQDLERLRSLGYLK